jgi:hypothetical protein
MTGTTSLSHGAALLLTACACLALGACAPASGGATSVQPQSTPISASVQKFCAETASALRSLDGPGITPRMTLAQARDAVYALLHSSIASFTSLERQVPTSLRASIGGTLAGLRGDQKAAKRAVSLRQLIGAAVKANPADEPPYQELLGYAGSTCRLPAPVRRQS